MKIKSLNYFFKEGLKSIGKNRLMSVASIMTVASCLFILAISICFIENINFAMQSIESDLGVSVFISEEATADEVDALYQQILALPYVENVEYISSEDAMEFLKADLGEDAAMLDGIPAEALPRSFVITLTDPSYQDELIIELNTYLENGIDEIVSNQSVFDALIVINILVHIVSGVIIVGLLLISFVIISNTIRLTVAARKNEISIMKYVGATDWFIRWPFLIEGIIIGLIGAIIPIVISSAGYYFITEVLLSNSGINFLNYLPTSEILPTIVITNLFIGIFVGVVASLISMRKYLDV